MKDAKEMKEERSGIKKTRGRLTANLGEIASEAQDLADKLSYLDADRKKDARMNKDLKKDIKVAKKRTPRKKASDSIDAMVSKKRKARRR